MPGTERQSVDALQDTLKSQVPEGHDDTPESDCVSGGCWEPLQDILHAQNAFLVGLTAFLCGEALQDTGENQP
jgi:hypothetical protein